MRFSYALVTGTLLLAPLNAPAQEAEPAGDPPAAEVEEAEPAAAPSQAFVEDGTCPQEMTSQRARGFGQPSAELDAGQAVYTPADLTVLDSPVAYVIVNRQSGANSAVTRLSYRLAGVNVSWGADHRPALRQAFDKAFKVDVCGKAGSTCLVDYRSPEAGIRASAELSTRMPSLPPGGTGDAMRLLRADNDLDGADPVFLICTYAER